MDNIKKITVYGKKHESPNKIYSQTLKESNLGFGTSVGVTSKANEDCIGISISENDVVLAIADGHWGNEASELAIKKASELLDSKNRLPKDNEARARLYSLFEQINTALYQKAMTTSGAPTPETTLIVCHLRNIQNEKYLFWSSFGDSFLFIFREGILKQLNSLNSYWLGMLSKLSENSATRGVTLKYSGEEESRYVGVAEGIEAGIEKLESNDIVFLCTDGLIGSDKMIPEEVANNIKTILISNTPLEKKIDGLILSALSRNEKDNVTCIVAQIP